MTINFLSSPFVRRAQTTPWLMQWVLLALLPGMLLQCYFFGIGTLIQVLLCAVFSLSFEALVMRLRKRSAHAALSDYSALVTGVLLGLALPAYAPWWVAFIGCAFAIIVVKHLYGGLGNNLFNPAMAAYVLLLVSFPLSMTSWPSVTALSPALISSLDGLYLIFTQQSSNGLSLSQLLSIDGFTLATPLDSIKLGLSQGYTIDEIRRNPVFSSVAGHGWQWINLGYLLGGLLLIKKGVIRYHLPFYFLLSLSLIAIIASAFGVAQSAPFYLHLLSGSTMLGAFFIITDPISAATSIKGRIIFASFIALLVYLIRTWGGYPDALAFAVLLANMCVPLIDHYTKPRVYGYKVENNND